MSADSDERDYKGTTAEGTPPPPPPGGKRGWYPDPYGSPGRRWWDPNRGWGTYLLTDWPPDRPHRRESIDRIVLLYLVLSVIGLAAWGTSNQSGECIANPPPDSGDLVDLVSLWHLGGGCGNRVGKTLEYDPPRCPKGNSS